VPEESSIDGEYDEKLITCTTKYVDCSDKGGYDPRDPCKHTCKDGSGTPKD